jgi:trehalose/maltose hydrolase-like predicted phosphorylase
MAVPLNMNKVTENQKKIMDNWNIVYTGWDEKEHPLREALCTLGNGYFAARGALEEQKANGYNYPGTYLAGGYNRAVSEIKAKKIENEDLVNWPNWIYLTFKIGDSDWFDFTKTELLEYTVTLNLEEGILKRKMRFRDEKFRETSFVSRRIVSMADPHVAAIQWELVPENWTDEITIRSGIDGDIKNCGVERYSELNSQHLDILETGNLGNYGIFLTSQTKQSKIRMTQAASLSVFLDEKELELNPEFHYSEKAVFQDLKIECRQNTTARVEKMVSVYTSKDLAVSDPLTEAREKLGRLDSFYHIFQKHRKTWANIWNLINLDVKSKNNEMMILRLHVFHLHQTISENSIGLDVGVPSRGWHGEAYRGHIFWDELYIFPYINFHLPQLARSLLMYRYHRLPQARKAARDNGYRGAMFPWQSGSNGREETQVMHLNPKSGRWIPDKSHLQRHINAAIPYNVWQYYQTTNDIDYLAAFGAELILDTALFWSEIAKFNTEKERYEINGIMGPDEYHTHYPDKEKPGLNNNAYTNFMAVWTIQCALNILEIFKGEHFDRLAQRVGLNSHDVEHWKDIAGKMYIPLQKNGIILQFDGFDKLQELNWEKYHKKYGEELRLDRILEKEGDSANNYRASKQADVMMLFYLFSSDELVEKFNQLGYDFKPDYIPKNIEYYEKVTSHGSTLSQVIHSWVLARSDRKRSWNVFREALMSDFEDVQGGTTPEGIHLGAMAGTLDIIQRCYTGLEIRDDVLWLNPRIPQEMNEVKFQIRYRSHWIKLRVTQEKILIDFENGWGEPIKLNVQGKSRILDKNTSLEFNLKQA